jgi:hypothetical protein
MCFFKVGSFATPLPSRSCHYFSVLDDQAFAPFYSV